MYIRYNTDQGRTLFRQDADFGKVCKYLGGVHSTIVSCIAQKSIVTSKKRSELVSADL
jgi:hypothetical protein